jgi:carbon storage regulator
MLVLARRAGEKILLPGLNVTVQVVSIKPGVVRLGIEAPAAVPIFREELLDRPEAWPGPDPQMDSAATA